MTSLFVTHRLIDTLTTAVVNAAMSKGAIVASYNEFIYIHMLKFANVLEFHNYRYVEVYY